MLDEIRNICAGNDKGTTLNWPSFSEIPISEYSNKIVFFMLFPWLYPDENGDFNESCGVDITIKQWMSQQMYTADLLFARDKC
jgi:hypothetical protein